MRSIWRGAVSFGLVSIGVKLYSATEDKDIRFHQVHATDGGRVKYKRVCSIDGEEVEYSDIAKGYELPDGQVVILTDEDFEDLPLSTRREIEVLQFVDQDEIDPIMFEKTYYLEPDGPAARPYVLLREALENAGQVAITKIAIRQRESLAALRIIDGVLVLHTMRWPDEIRTPDFGFLDEDISVRPQELKMAEALIASMTGEFDPSEFTDDYREAMTALLEAKQSGGEVQQVPEVPDSGAAVVDLMSALRRSVGGFQPWGAWFPRNSLSVRVCRERRFASSSCGSRFGSSSRKAATQLGSTPTTWTPAWMWGRKTSSIRRQNSRAASSIP